MRYDELRDPPDGVGNNAAKHVREVPRAVYDPARSRYGDEGRAHRVAWSVVEKEYGKNDGGDWVEKVEKENG